MNEIPISVLAGTLVFLICLSAFFSGSETSLVSLNRYRLRHLSKTKHRGAQRASRLLERPDRLIGLILLGNNFVNILASSIASIMALRLFDEGAIFSAAILLTLVILIFAEVAPKTLAVLHPERFAFPATFILEPLLKLLYPIVWSVNLVANTLLKLIGTSTNDTQNEQLTSEELRTVVSEAGAMIPRRHQKMLTNILDLEKVTVNDIMIPRNEIIGLDMDDDWEHITKQLTQSQHTRFPVYRSDINNVIGLLHVRNTLEVLFDAEATKEDLTPHIKKAYFVPEGTSLNTQLLQFQRQKRRIGLVVDEYGDIQGLVTLEDILEEIVGEFTSDPATSNRDIHIQPDGTYLIDGSVTIRELNRSMNWNLPSDGPKTFNGLILEQMESIPESGTSILIAGYPIEIVQIKDNTVKVARVNPEFIIKDKPNTGNTPE
ncbi:MAG: HlyC/CorC family transporter [Gammaproteobacteria bacterium]|nr:HlyC/CorC family transporter [Gammaproteobacteria bacterium]